MFAVAAGMWYDLDRSAGRRSSSVELVAGGRNSRTKGWTEGAVFQVGDRFVVGRSFGDKTPCSAEAQPDQHITFSRSTDEGVTWSAPRVIAGPKRPGDGHIASWGFPLVSQQGRIYVPPGNGVRL
jgi:hypothetical protein